ncbi:NAD(P)/FAD-dependent oxidoreductase [Streptomyces daliensis]
MEACAAGPPDDGSADVKVIIVGAGFGGIAAAIELRRHGFDELTLLEAAPEPGGTWHYNRYPGAACDVPSHFYSYSYAQRPDWSRLCSPQPEILEYLRGVAAEFGVDRSVVTGMEVTSCHWDEDACRWTVHARDAAGERHTWHGEALVLATGQLNQPAVPALPGRAAFEGHSFHSARWDHGYDLRDKRVAVVGTGASAVQFVPEIASRVSRLTVFQRTGNWFLPLSNGPYPRTVRALLRRVPGLRAVWRAVLFSAMELLTAAIRHPGTLGRFAGALAGAFMRRQLRDPEVRRKAWPTYPFGCKRVLFSSTFLPALQGENVELVTAPITGMSPRGPVTADGRTHEVDCVIYATGFRTNDFMLPMEITGTGGRSLREAWARGPRAHLGITVPGFPSMFLMYGPNTNTSGGSIIFFLQAQARYLCQALRRVRTHRAAAIEVRAEAEAADVLAVRRRFDGTAWLRCDSWYRDAAGRNVANWPGYMREYAARTRTLDPADFRLLRGNRG